MKNTEFKSQNLKYLYGVEYSESTLKPGSTFYCKQCSQKKKTVIEFPLKSGNKLCSDCFTQKIKTLNYRSKDKSMDEKKQQLTELLFPTPNFAQKESEENDIKSKKTKYIDKVAYEVTNYKSLHTITCSLCHKTKKTTVVILTTKGDKPQEICHGCYQKIISNTQKVMTAPTTAMNYYSKVPFLHPKLAEKKLCVICKKALVRDKIVASLYDKSNKFVQNSHIDTSYCRRCNVGYADNRTMKYIDSTFPELQLDTFTLVKKSLGNETHKSLWSAINSRYGEVTKNIQQHQNIKPQKKEIISQTIVEETLPLGSTIYIGIDDTHPCNGPMVGRLLPYNKKLINNHGLPIDAELKECARCKKIFISEARYAKAKQVLNNYNFVEKPMPIHKLSPKDFITRVYVFHCSNKEHILKDIKCIIKLLDFSGKLLEVEIPAAYCTTCKKYYILDSEYKKLKARGIIVCKVVEKEFWTGKYSGNGYALNQESTLHILGYNVNAQANISQAQRWRILEIAVDEKILTRTEICAHLDYLINRSKGRKNFENACSKWMTDRNHIISYNTADVQRIEAQSITINTHRKGR